MLLWQRGEAHWEDERDRYRDVLESHGLRHLSFSKIESASNLADFLMRIDGQSDESVGVAAKTGSWGEDGLAAALNSEMTTDEAIARASAELTIDSALEPKNKRDAAVRSLEARIRTGVELLEPLGPADTSPGWQPFMQDNNRAVKQISRMFYPWWSPVPLLTYMDFYWSTISADCQQALRNGPLEIAGDLSDGYLLDTKMPQKRGTPAWKRDSYMRQLAIYSRALGCRAAGALELFPEGKTGTLNYTYHDLSAEASQHHIVGVAHRVHAICKFLSLSPDVRELASYITPDRSHWKLTSGYAQDAITDIFGY
jgi:hypothetical protein